MTRVGLGWGMHPTVMVEDHLAAGRLVELVPAQRVDVPLYWTVIRLQTRALRQLTEAVCAAAGPVLSR